MMNEKKIEIINGKCLYIRLSGKHNTGDMINLSFVFFNKLKKLLPGSSVLIDIRGVQLKLIKGLLISVSKQFFQMAKDNNIKKIAAIFSADMVNTTRNFKFPSYLRVFCENEIDNARQWLEI